MNWLPSRQAPWGPAAELLPPALLDYRNNLGGSRSNPTPTLLVFMLVGLPIVCTQISPEGVPGGVRTNSLGCLQSSPHSCHGGLLVLDPWGAFKLSTKSAPANSPVNTNNNTNKYF